MGKARGGPQNGTPSYPVFNVPVRAMAGDERYAESPGALDSGCRMVCITGPGAREHALP